MDLPFGWVSKSLKNALEDHVIGKKNILEIGSFVGRSTCIIASKIRELKLECDFDTIDLHFLNKEEFISFYTNVYKKDFTSEYERLSTEAKIFIKNGTEIHLRKHLEERGLDKYVNVLKGDFKTNEIIQSKKYDLIYCDVSHDVEEIMFNCREISKLSNDDAVLIFDDINNNDQVEALHRVFTFKYFKRIDSTGIGVVNNKN
jgi:hypothetical protein